MTQRRPPGQVRDAIIEYLRQRGTPATTREIHEGVRVRLGPLPSSSVRSYLRLNTGRLFERTNRGTYGLRT